MTGAGAGSAGPRERIQQAARFAEKFYRSRDGETVVVGLKGGEPHLAFAAGLSTERHKTHLGTLARYLFERHGIDGYLVIMPADLANREVVAVESCDAAGRSVYAADVRRDPSGRVEAVDTPRRLDGAAALLGDLLTRGRALPGIQRRALDRAFDALRIDFPGAL